MLEESARRLFDWVTREFARRIVLAALITPCLASAFAYWAGGAVASGIAGTYAALGAWGMWRARTGRYSARARAVALETVGALAGELRAGGEASVVSALVAGWLRGEVSEDLTKVGRGQATVFPRTAETMEVVRRMATACRVSELLGAPLADLFDGIERDLREIVRLRRSLSAQISGSWATVVILAALPLAGLGLGIGMGVDPLRQLLHTPMGAGCAGLALALQAAGLLWTSALVTTATESL
jgi:tight adherence protein B